MADEDSKNEQLEQIEVNERTFDERLRELRACNAHVDKLTAELKEANTHMDSLSWALARYMLATGCTKKVLDGVTYTQKQRVFSKVTDKEALRNWIFSNDAVDLLMAVNSSKLTAYCNECLESGGTVPPGVDPSFIKYSVSVKQ